MILKKPAMAGTLESSDVQITVRPNVGGGIQINLRSIVKSMFGDAIEATIREILEESGVTEAIVEVDDKGALDFVIRARMQCAVCRAAESSYDWRKEGEHGRK